MMKSIVLLALTGFGNSVLRALIKARMPPLLVCTRHETGPHPYYQEVNLAAEANSHGIPVQYDLPADSWFKKNSIHTLVTATYHRIVPEPIIRSVRYALNLHPSLLPAYRGASPCYWVIKNREQKTGLTLHSLTSEVDRGPIWGQLEVPIDAHETQGTIRQKLAFLAGDFLLHNLTGIDSGSITSIPAPTGGSYFPKFDADVEMNLSPTAGVRARYAHARALLPWPGVRVNDRTINNLQDLDNFVRS